MARKSSIKQVVLGMTLREFLLMSLVKQSYRQLLASPEFKLNTGIKSLGNFYNQAEKMDINLKTIYSYAIETRMIPHTSTFEEWISMTRKNYDTSKLVSEKEKLMAVGNEYGFVFSEYMSQDDIKNTLLDFLSETEINERMSKIKEKR
ncbi:MAG: hypothetical protein ACRCZ9_05750 [Fusobacteriaceae bacterium]